MNAFYFGGHERRLFGIYEAARRARANHAVVLCHPWGGEYIHAYRSMRRLAEMLTARGVHTLRFDYFGAGDSAGSETDGDIGGWESDIETAIAELRDMTEATQVSLIGLRLGATLAAKVAGQAGSGVDSLVLWDPVVSGSEYLRELDRAARQESWKLRLTGPRRTADGGHEILGFPLTAPMAAGFRQLDLAALAPALPQRTLIVASQRLNAHMRLRRALDGREAPIDIEQIDDGPPAWVEWPVYHPLAGALPVKLLHRIVEWLT